MRSSTVILGKVIAHDTVVLRAARTGDSTIPLIVSIPKHIVGAMKVKKGDRLRIYTDGQKIYLDRFEGTEI